VATPAGWRGNQRLCQKLELTEHNRDIAQDDAVCDPLAQHAVDAIYKPKLASLATSSMMLQHTHHPIALHTQASKNKHKEAHL
jgi:hypothetical protein